jgi:phosphoglycerate dehydrogenase-like enzyme
MKVLIDYDLNEKYLEKMRELISDAEIVKATERETQRKEIVDAEILISFMGFPLDILQKEEKLQWIQSWSAGVDGYTKPDYNQYLIENNIKLTSMSGVHRSSMADHTFGFIINHTRRFCDMKELQKKKKWKRLRVGQLEGKTMAVIGLGSIGKEIAVRGKAFRMRVIGVKRNTDEVVENVDQLFSSDQLHEALSQADFVVSIVPLTGETEMMFGREEFEAMKDSGYFINMARGEVVNQPELITALQEEMIAGAGLDVFVEEPLPEDSPLYSLDNVFVSPHMGGKFPDYNKKAIRIFKENLKKYIASQEDEMINLVDYERGY